jgi:hypothetical protein
MFSPAALTVIKVFAPKLWCLLFFGILPRSFSLQGRARKVTELSKDD